MKRRMGLLEIFPFAFFIFLSSFMIVKSIFILLFNAPFSPSFILRLTPLYLIPNIEESQLLFFSLLVIVIDTYLHIKDTKKNLLYSFIPSLIILCSISLFIISNDFSINYAVYYLLFVILLGILVIDNKRTLPETLPEPSRRSTPIHNLNLLDRIIGLSFRAKPVNVPSQNNPLSQIEELKPPYTTALEIMGIKSIEKLAESDPEVLFGDIKDLEPEVDQKMVENWIKSAKELTGKITVNEIKNNEKLMNKKTVKN